MRDIKNGDYCTLSGFLTSMCSESQQYKTEEVIVERETKQPIKPVTINITININFNKK